jgi:hypothetical protein
MTPTIRDVLKETFSEKEWDNINEHGRQYIRKAMQTYAASLNRQGWTRVEEQEKLWDDLIEEVLNIDWYSMTSKDTIQIKELKSKYQLMPLPNKPEPI